MAPSHAMLCPLESHSFQAQVDLHLLVPPSLAPAVQRSTPNRLIKPAVATTQSPRVRTAGPHLGAFSRPLRTPDRGGILRQVGAAACVEVPTRSVVRGQLADEVHTWPKAPRKVYFGKDSERNSSRIPAAVVIRVHAATCSSKLHLSKYIKPI